MGIVDKILKEADSGLEQLKSKLLAIAPEENREFYNEDDFVDIVVSRGKEWNLPVKRVEGQPVNCHKNTATYFFNNMISAIQNHKARIVTGYYFSKKNKSWIRHSWIVEEGQILETTKNKALHYFGAQLNGQESIDFIRGEGFNFKSYMNPEEVKQKIIDLVDDNI